MQRYGLRLYHPQRNVDDTYFSSDSNGQYGITGIPLAKVAIRLYLNLYTTSDGRPPRNIKIIIVSSTKRNGAVDDDDVVECLFQPSDANGEWPAAAQSRSDLPEYGSRRANLPNIGQSLV